MHIAIKVLAFMLLFVHTYEGKSQTVVDISKITIEDGLADRVVYHIERDSFGFFYIVTENYIQRYDGVDFLNVDLGPLDKAKVKTRDIRYLEQGVDGNIYLVDLKHHILGMINPGSLAVSESHLSNETRIYHGQFWEVLKQADNYKFSPYEDKTKTLVLDTFPNDILLNNDGIYYESDSTIFHYSSDQIQSLDYAGKLSKSGDHIYIINNVEIWGCLHGECHLIYEPNHKDLGLQFAEPDKSGNLMVAYSKIPRFIDHFITIKDSTVVILDTISSKDRVFKTCYADNALNKIMTGGYTGLHVFSLLKPHASFLERRTPGKELFGYIVSGLAVDQRGTLTFLNEGRGISQYDGLGPPERILKNYRDGKAYIRNGKMHYSKEDDIVYSSTFYYSNDSDVYALDTKTNNPEYIRVPFKVKDIESLGNQELVLAGFIKTMEGELGSIYTLNFKNKTYQKVFTYPDGFYDIYYDRTSNVYWLGSRKGLLCLDEDFNLLETFDRYQNDPKKNIDEDFINYIKRHDEHLYIGSIGGGLYIMDLNRREIIKQISRKNGLSDNKVVSVEVDKSGNLWVATFNGLNVIGPDYKLKRIYYQQDGLPDKEFNSSASAQDQNGKMYFGTVNGLLIIDPEEVLQWPTSHGLYASEIEVREDSRAYAANELNVRHTADSVQIKLLYPDFVKGPFQKHFISMKSPVNAEAYIEDDQIVLKQFRPGNEEIMVKSNFNNTRIGMPLEISYNYFPILRILGFVGLVLITFFMWTLYQRQKSVKNIELNKRIAGLELTALQAQMNPHFVFNALGAIQYFIQTNDAEKADDYLSNFAQLMRMILESSKTKYITIQNEMKLLNLYIGLEKIRFEDKFDAQIIVDEKVNPEFQLPPMIVQPFVENAINHGLLHLEDKKGELLIRTTYIDDDTVKITIEDNGIGRKKAALLASRSHKSRGMQIVNERIETFNKDGNFEVTSSIQDLIEEGGSALGTRVHLFFKDYQE